MKRRNINIDKIIDFPDGSHYEGEVNDKGQPHGKGYMDSPSPTGCLRRDRYEGEFKNGKKDGFGYMNYELNGYVAEYEGEWKDDKRCGKGKYKHYSMGGGASHRYQYEGEWLDDMEHGYGVSVNSDERGMHLSTISEKYEGGFKEGKRHGHGKITKDGYDGNFAKGKEYYEGEFEDGKLVGPGVHKMVNGDVCEFLDGYKEGRGIYTFADGKKFTAIWEKGELDFNTIEFEGYDGKQPLLLMVAESHHGFGYSESVRCVIFAQKGKNYYNEAMILSNYDFHINSDYAYLEIKEITDDSVTYVVKSGFTNDHKEAFTETIKRGERNHYEEETEHTGRMYDDDFTYTSGSELIICCK